MENFEKIDVRNKIARNSYFYENQIQYFKGQNYLKLKSECLSSGRLFTDPAFTPSNANLYYSKSIPYGVRWMRPHEIMANRMEPKFVVNKAEAHDLDQGYLGNCWFIAACAAVTMMPELFDKVVPKSQVCSGHGYCGIFHFRFWIYGLWYDVVVDDYLPVWENSRQLVFCSNKEEPNEFWAALLEKAYAKVCGNYENLEGGFTSDALIDLTGGIEETFALERNDSEKNRNNLWKIMYKSREMKSMAAAYIDPNPYVFEEKMSNGLVRGHAYTISKIALLSVNNRDVRLVRLRNPWGKIEWKGAWSDSSSNWSMISPHVKNSLEFKIDNEGEFWMCFEDFCHYFDSIQFCHLTPDSFSDELLRADAKNKNISWKMIAYHGEWRRNVSAGGSGNGGDRRFWTNPQFLVKLVDVDVNDDDNLATMIVALMQKFTREKRSQNHGQTAEEFIQFRLFRVLKESDAERSVRTGEKLQDNQVERVGNSGNYINKREVTQRFRLKPGHYLIIPSTFDANMDGQFVLRIFTEKYIEDRNTVILINDTKPTYDNSYNIPQSGMHTGFNVNSGRGDTSFFSQPSNFDGNFKSWISAVGHGAADRAKYSMTQAKSQLMAGSNLADSFSKLLNINETQSENIRKEVVSLKNNLKKQQVCSVM